jgi:hypothetical protein
MKSAAASPTRKTKRARRGLIERTLLKAARAGGYKITRVSPAEMAKAKGDIRTGKATPDEIQSKNDMLPGKIEVLDWSPIFA